MNMLQYEELLAKCAREKINVRSDSRKVEKGDIFVAIAGENQDGREFISQAAANGAGYIVLPEAAGTALPTSCPAQIAIHSNPREAVWQLAAARWGTAETKCVLIGVTGTNGKTTSAFLLERIFSHAGRKVGVLGTINYHWPGFSMPAPLTTPDPISLHEMVARMEAAGVEIIIMEVSSHSLVQQRVGGLPFSGAIFTNLSQDHLDFHKDMEDYFQAKSKLFLELPKADKAIAINGDDPHGRCLADKCPGSMSYGLEKRNSPANFLQGEVISHGPSGMRLKMSFGGLVWELDTKLVGDFNAYNLLGVQALGLQMGLKPEDFSCLQDFHGVCGRLERIPNPKNSHVFVDYAHSPDALIKALQALRGAGFKRIVTVFGCGGNRDRGKRPLMGEAVSQFSDVVILTSDNPRYEDPAAIIEDVKPGLGKARQLFIEIDRRKATALALDLLGEEDALLIAGKGHEDYQIINGQKFHYSDQESVRELTTCA